MTTDEIKRLIAEATPGPWVAEHKGGRGAWVKGETGEWSALACGDTDASAEANARLIAAAPDLAAQVVRLTKTLTNLERAASEVSRLGAQTGPQWSKLTTALLFACVALGDLK